METEFFVEEFELGNCQEFVIVGDVGGTHTTMAVCALKPKPIMLFKCKFRSRELARFTDAVNETLAFAHHKYNITISRSCFDFAGPLYDDNTRVQMTNLNWEVTKNQIFGGTTLSETCMLNDIEAMGYGTLLLPQDKIIQLPLSVDGQEHYAQPAPRGNKGILAAGTGLGAGFLTFNKELQKYHSVQSEGGHSTLIARDSEELEFIRFILETQRTRGFTIPDWESALSGYGLENHYLFLLAKAGIQLPQEMNETQNMAKVISKHANAGTCQYCEAALNRFMYYYGLKTAECAFNFNTRGGMYVGGGVATKNMNFLRNGNLMQAYFSSVTPDTTLFWFLKNTPVYVINTYDSNLYGCLYVLDQMSDSLSYKR
ncbi:glucokinase [Candidatus Woesearchaeota archaeon]|nr:glucokinase [Candidatus Woesearchaeota archaeon]